MHNHISISAGRKGQSRSFFPPPAITGPGDAGACEELGGRGFSRGQLGSAVTSCGDAGRVMLASSYVYP